MRKKIIQQAQQQESPAVENRLNLAELAQAELTSEDENHPIEAALTAHGGAGWRAAHPGEQTIRLVFDAPQKIKEIQLVFREEQQERTQEFLLRWLPAGEQQYRELVRQQYNFSPPHTLEQSEVYTVNLDAVQALELQLIPDISGGGAIASIAKLRLS